MKLKLFFKQLFCKHKEWVSDNQIRTIECVTCGKRARVIDYIDLYRHGK